MPNIKKAISDGFGQLMQRYSPAIITLIVMGAAFYLYTHVVIRQNENTIRERSFRGLGRMAGNIREKILIYAEQNSRNFATEIAGMHKVPKADSTRERNRIEESYGLSAEMNPASKEKADSFYFKSGHQYKIVFPFNGLEATAPVDRFVQAMLRKDLFPYYFLAHNNKVLFDEINPSNDSIQSIAAGQVVIDTSDKQSTTEFSRILQVETGGIRYKLFMMPFSINGKHDFVIGAYLPEEQFEAESRYIPGIIIMWLVFGIVLVILMFPLLKVLLMNRVEPLLPRNVLTSLISIHILGSILILILVNLYSYYYLVRGRADMHVKHLNEQIHTVFQQEVMSAVGEIDIAERELIDLVNKEFSTAGDNRNPDLYGTRLPDSCFKLHPPVRAAKGADSKRIYQAQNLGSLHPYFDRITWIDTSGEQYIRWANGENFAPRLNVRNRDYFKAVINKELFQVNGKEYFLTTVASWVSKKKLGIIARPSQLPQLADSLRIADPAQRKKMQALLSRARVVSFSSVMRSVFGPVLPHGFGFCMVNPNGEVIFHSDENRSLNENLIKECNEDKGLTAMFTTGTEIFFNAPYSASNYRFFSRPVYGMPFYLVTFYDNQYLWNFDLDVVSASSIMVLMNMGAILLLVLFARLLSFKMLSRSILFIWIEPKSHRWQAYLKATAGFLAAFLLTLGFASFSSQADELYLLCMSLGYTHLVITFAYYVYNKSDEQATSTHQSRGAGNLVQDRQAGKNRFARNIRPFHLLMASYVLGFAGICWKLECHSRAIFIWSQLSLLVVLAVIVLLKKYWQTFSDQRYKRYYYWSSFSFILATAIVPAFLFYVLSFREEQKLVLKFQQLDLINNVVNKQLISSRFVDAKTVSYHTPVYFSTLVDRFKYSDTSSQLKRNATNFGNLYSRIKPSFSSYARQIGYMNVEGEMPGSFAWTNVPVEDTMVFNMDVFRKTGIARQDSAGLRLRVLALKKVPTVMEQFWQMFKDSPIIHLVIIALLVLVLAGLAWLLVGLIPKVFFFGKPAVGPTEQLDARFAGIKPRVYHAYVLGIVNSGKYRKIMKIYQDYLVHELDIAWLIAGTGASIAEKFNTKWKYILNDLDTHNTEEELQKRVVIIRHFDMKMDDISVTLEKLQKLEDLLAYKHVQIVISSSRHFDAMDLTDEKTNQDYTDRWANVMNNFCTFYHRWMPDKLVMVEACHGSKAVSDLFTPDLDTLFKTECSHSNYLIGLLNPVKQSICEAMQPWGAKKAGGKVVPEYCPADLAEIFYQKVEKLSYHYYLSLWQSVNVDEQRTLYDIASDGLMNQRNQDVANNLFAMGLLRINTSESGFSIMNESFRRFILTRLDKAEISKLHDGTAPDHSWNRFQLPIIIVVITVSLFLIITQKEAFNNMVAWLGAAAGGIAALLRILDVIPNSKANNT